MIIHTKKKNKIKNPSPKMNPLNNQITIIIHLFIKKTLG